VLTDIDLAYAFSLGLVFWVGDKIKEAYRQFGIDLERFQGQGGWLLPIPATLVIGKDGRVKASQVDPDFRPWDRGDSARARRDRLTARLPLCGLNDGQTRLNGPGSSAARCLLISAKREHPKLPLSLAIIV